MILLLSLASHPVPIRIRGRRPIAGADAIVVGRRMHLRDMPRIVKQSWAIQRGMVSI